MNCQFYWWDRGQDYSPAILSQNGDLSVIGCEFGEVGKLDIFLSRRIRSAIITGNTFRTKRGVINKARKKRSRIKNNLVSFPTYKRPPSFDKKKLSLRIEEWNR